MKTLVTGGTSEVAKELKRLMPDAVFVSTKDYNLTKEEDVWYMYKDHMPHRVIHMAARVGGIMDNINHPAEYIEDNLLMNTLVTKWAREFRVDRFTAILTTCMYPDQVHPDEYPLREELLMCGPPPETNLGYAYTKRALALQIDAYNHQYGTKYNYVIPCNLYSWDERPVDRLHFVPAVIKRIKEAQEAGRKSITLYGNGTPLRQFMYKYDLAKVLHQIAERDITDSFNVANPENLSIRDMAYIIRDAMQSDVEILWDSSKPNGQYRRDVSLTKFRKHFPDFQFTSLYDGVQDIVGSDD